MNEDTEYRTFDDRFSAAFIFTVMTLAGIGCGILSIFESEYAKANVAPIIFSVTILLFIATIFAWVKLNKPDSKLWKY